ncbi:DUF3857 and transglutaminase domain-containing protein [Pseudomonas sp. zfem002]|uniref:DUF3857 domain-containing transglutaminase family protein n=1 Tax=Pseudomonas sp. zfem002 TaxID=3078197 RepID=UPI00292991FB|nr:DUF3857 and transglutaminase domain-containing protein [Pseudomonas sp. zfem002]MDU9394635.1 DUF3857 and transglutaminase domain-containing protein [Pseudomonas sp. zfem002]
MKWLVSRPAGWLGLLVCLLTLNLAHAAEDGRDRSVTVEKDARQYRVEADGSFALRHELVFHIEEERAIKDTAQQSLPYNRTVETLEVLEAYTEKPDGRKVAVSAEQIKEQQQQASADAPMFLDSLVKVVIFPEVAVGDRLVLTYKRQRATALFPGQFEDTVFPYIYPVRQMSVVYDLPADLALQADARDFKPSTPPAAGGRKVWRWDYQHDAQPRMEIGAVSYADYGQYLAVSTFADYAAFARAYAARAQFDVTPAIAELAKSLTATIADPRAKALVLSDWVRKNVRFVAVYIGAGGVVPHAAETVLNNRYGDCKDHVALLGALLAAVEIHSTPALLNLGNAYQLPRVATLGVINHAITYIPSLDLYLDPTMKGIAAGFLPLADMDKPTLLVASATLARTPKTQANTVKSRTTFSINEQGEADFSNDSTIEGWGAELNRYGLRNMAPGERDMLVQRILSSYNQSGNGRVEGKKLDKQGHGFQLRIDGHSRNLVNLPGPIGVPTLSSFAGGIAQNVLGFVSEKERKQAFLCVSSLTEEEARFDFPAQVQILATPKPVALKVANLEYRADYRREGNSVVVTRRMDFRNAGSTCTPEQLRTLLPTVEALIRDLNSQVIVQQS